MNRTKEERLLVLYTLIFYSLFLLALYLSNVLLILIFLPYLIVSVLYLYLKRYLGFFILISVVLILSSFVFISTTFPYILSEGPKVSLAPYLLAIISAWLLFVLSIRIIGRMKIIKEPALPYLSLNMVLFILLILSTFITVKTCTYALLFLLLGVFLISLPFLTIASALICSKYPECSNERLAGLSLIPIFWGLFVLLGGPLLYFMVGTFCGCITIFPIFLFFYMFGNLWIGFTFFSAYVIRKRSTV